LRGLSRYRIARRVEIGPQLMARDSRRTLNRKDTLSRDTPPLRDSLNCDVKRRRKVLCTAYSIFGFFEDCVFHG
jgi:hypothetical protein